MRILLISLLIVYLYSCAPSGDIDNYSDYFVKEDSLSNASVSVTFFGVSTLLFDDGSSQILVDGFFSRPSASQVIFKKLKTDQRKLRQVISNYKINKLEAIFTTHTHYDHALDAAILAKMTSAKLHGSESTLNLGRGAGLSEDQLNKFKGGDTLYIGNFQVQILKGKHSPPKLLNNDLGEEVLEPLKQGARFSKYKEGGSFDFLITHGDLSFYVKPSPNYITGALDSFHADVLFLGTGSIGNQKEVFLNHFYDETVAKLKPSTLIPIHWDNFLKRDFQKLKMMPRYMDKGARTFDHLIRKSQDDGIDFIILLGGRTMHF